MDGQSPTALHAQNRQSASAKDAPGTDRANGHVQAACPAAGQPGLAALEAHYKASYGTLYGIALRMVHSPETAADVVQEAYADTAAKMRAGLEIENLGGWLYKVVRNQCLGRLRSPTVLPLDEDVEIVRSYSPAEIAELKARCAAIRSAIEELPEPQRPALIMAELRGMRYSEIAETLELSIDSVRLHLYRAREKVRRAVGPETFALLFPLLRFDEAVSRMPPCPEQSFFQALMQKTGARFARFQDRASAVTSRLAESMPHVAQVVASSVLAAVVVTAGAETMTSDRHAEPASGSEAQTVAQAQPKTPVGAQAHVSAPAPTSLSAGTDSPVAGGNRPEAPQDAGGKNGNGGTTGGDSRSGGDADCAAGPEAVGTAGACQTSTPAANQTPTQPASAPTGGAAPSDGDSTPSDGGGDDESPSPPDSGTWSSPVDVSSALGAYDGERDVADVAVSANGAAVAVWNIWNASGGTVQASYREAGAGSSWGTPVDLSAPGQPADSARVAIDDEGDAVAVWREFDGSHYVIRAATRILYLGGGSWSSAVGLSDGGQNAGSPDIALSGRTGDGIVTWIRSNGTDNIVQAAVVHANGDFDAPSNLSAAGQNATDPAVDINDARDAMVVWTRWDGVTGYVVQAARKFGGDLWQAVSDVSTPGGDPTAGASKPQVGLYDGGDAVVAWQNANHPRTVKSATQHGGDPWTAPQAISSASTAVTNVKLAVDGAGNAVAVWSGGSYSYPFSVQAATRPAGGSWSDATTISSSEDSGIYPDVGIGADGTVVAVWQHGWPNTMIDAATLSFGGSWSEPATISSGSGESVHPHVDVADDGNAVAVWMNYSTQTIQSARYEHQ